MYNYAGGKGGVTHEWQGFSYKNFFNMCRIPEVTMKNSQHANLGNAYASHLFGWAAARGRGICRKFILARKRGFCVFLTQIFSQYLCDHGNKLESYASHNSGHVFHYFFYHFFKNPEGFRPRSKPPRRKLSNPNP